MLYIQKWLQKIMGLNTDFGLDRHEFKICFLGAGEMAQ